MPALIHFHRKWLIACDDFVIPSATEAIIRFAWLLAAFLMTFLYISDCNDCFITRCLFYAIIGDLFCTSNLCLIISILSSRGSVLEVQKRAHLPKLLYVKCMTVLIDVAIASFSVWYLQKEYNICIQKKVFIEVTAAFIWLYLLSVIVGVFICYSSLGSSEYWNIKRNSNSVKLFKRAEQIWKFRLKFFCFCADISEENNDFIFVEISSFLNTLSSEIDATPTDILAGLIVLSKKHAIERKKPFPKETLKVDTVLANKPVLFWMTAENALYFLRVAKGSYGWLAFCDPLRPWKLCTLLPSKRCFKCCGEQDERKQGDCLNCSSTAFQKISGYSSSEVLYASFSNSVYKPAFVVILDHKKESLIIAIRGTSSFSDLITDLDREQLDFPPSPTVKCHRGALHSALHIQKIVNEINVLSMTFVENPMYNLVLCGHSLGGSIAAILGLLLLPEYPSLQCYAYAPLPVLSSDGVFKTLDFVFTIAVEDDMIVRLSVNSIKELRREMCKSLQETHIPKYKLLLKAIQFYLEKRSNISKKTVLSSEMSKNKGLEVDESPVEIDQTVVEVDESRVESDQTIVEHQVNMPVDETCLYTPGRILHLRRGEKHDYSWITGFHFQKIIISPYIIKDHQPHQIQNFLEKYISSIESNETIEPEAIHAEL